MPELFALSDCCPCTKTLLIYETTGFLPLNTNPPITPNLKSLIPLVTRSNPDNGCLLEGLSNYKFTARLRVNQRHASYRHANLKKKGERNRQS